MAQTTRILNDTLEIRRSTTNAAPETLNIGELAYSYVSNVLFIGDTAGGVIRLLSNVGGEGGNITLIDSDISTDITSAATANAVSNVFFFTSNAYSLAANAIGASGGNITGNLSITNELDVGPLNIYWSVVNISDGSATIVEQYAVTDMATARFMVQMKSGSGYHSLEFFVVQDGTNIFSQEYSEIYTQQYLGAMTAQIVGGQVQITLTPTNQNTIVKVARYGLSA